MVRSKAAAERYLDFDVFIRQRQPAPGMGAAEELEEINEYSRDHHHGEDPSDGATDLIDAPELVGFLRRTLKRVNNLQS